MGPDSISGTCFTCGKQPLNFHKISDSDGDPKLNVCHIICQHFWFKEDDLQNSIVCETCWEKVDQFHQFYLDVKNLHEHCEVAPLSMFIKQEEITIEETQLQENCVDLSAEDQKLFNIADCKHEMPEECVEISKKEEPARKIIHSAKPQPNRRVVKRKNPRSRKPLNPEERQAEDDFIKQHTRYICEECNIEFDNFIAIKNHRIKTHSKDTVVCCNTQHRTRYILYQHVQKLLNPEAFKCEICSKSFKTKNSYVRHKEVTHAAEEKLVFKCNRCPKSFITERFLKHHLTEHETLENETAKCEFCGKCFRNKKVLNYHVKAVHKKQMDFICEVCSKGFYERGKLLMHQKTHELTAEQLKEQCSVCNKWLKNHKNMLEHMRRHKGGECKCELCGHVSINMMSLKAHMTRNHGPNKKQHVCEQCGMEYTRAIKLKEHIANAHTRVHLYQCEYCEKKFFLSANMYSHRRKAHPQEWLELQKANMMGLKVHMTRNHGPNKKQHVCEQCGKEYTRAIKLKEHIATAHTKEHLYQCEHCEKKFFLSTKMYSHRKRDHPEEWLESQKARREETSDVGETVS